MKKEAAAKIAEAKEEAHKQAHPEAAKEAEPSKAEVQKAAANTLENSSSDDAKKAATPAKTAAPAKAAAPAKKPVVEKKEDEGATHEAKVMNH